MNLDLKYEAKSRLVCTYRKIVGGFAEICSERSKQIKLLPFLANEVSSALYLVGNLFGSLTILCISCIDICAEL